MDGELVASEPEVQSPEKQDVEEPVRAPDNHETVAYRQSKLKLLVRSHAIREAASPPPDPTRASDKSSKIIDETLNVGSEVINETAENECFNELTAVNRSTSASSTETYSAPIQSEGTYTDNTGIDLTQFIIETLHRNQKDRTTLLRIEQEMVSLVRDGKRTCHRFPPMSSYHRMLVHRVAAFFGLEHNVDQSGNSVVVSKSSRTRLPEVAFKQYVREDVVLPEEPLRKFHLKREVFSLDDPARNADCRSLRSAHSFDHGNCDRTQAAKCYPAQFDGAVLVPSIGFDKSPCACRCCLPTCDPHACRQQNQNMLRVQRIQKVESLDATELRSTHQRGFRPAVAKSYSFGGYGTTSYSVPDFAENHVEGSLNVAPQRLHGVKQQSSFSCRLSKQDSNSSSVSISRSSPTSSGYKSQQSQSVSAAPSPTPLAQNRLQSRQPNSWNNSIESQNSGPELLVPGEPAHGPEGVSSLLWAVTSLDAVPPGSILINPQTGQPFYNPDGTVYRYDPQYSLPSHVETVICSQQSEELRNTHPDFPSHREDADLNPYTYSTGMVQLPANAPTIEQRAFGQNVQVPAVPFPSSTIYEPGFQNVDERRGGIECIAVPQANGYFLYQTSGTVESGPSHLNCMMKNLQLRNDDSRARCEASANLPSLSVRPGFAMQNSLPSGSFPIPAGPGTLLPTGATAISSNPCLPGVQVHPGNVTSYPAGNQYPNYPPVVYSVPPNAVHSHHGCSQYLLNGYAQQQYNNSQQFISSTFPVIVTQNPPNESLDREKGNAQCGILPGSYLPLAYRPGDSTMIVQSGELDQEPRPGHYGIQRQFSLQSPPTCALNSLGNQSLNPGRPSRHNRAPGVGIDAGRGPKKGRSVVQQHVKQLPNEKSQNLSN